MPERKRTTLLVTIEQDPVPGWGHNPQDHVAWLGKTLESLIGHYHPTVELVPGEEPMPFGDALRGYMELMLERAPRIDLATIEPDSDYT